MNDLNRIFEDNPTNPGYVLVLRPFGGDYDRIWSMIGNELEKTFKWIDVGALNEGGSIIDQVLRAIARTDVVVVDATGGNPNVFYELGIAHVKKGPNKVVILTQGTPDQKTVQMPFDVQSNRYLKYDPTNPQAMLPNLERQIKDALEPTAWFRVAEGNTHRSEPLWGDDGAYQFEVKARTLAGKSVRRESVEIEVKVFSYPSGNAATPDSLITNLSGGQTWRIPKLKWFLKFENFEEENGIDKAIICVVPDASAKP
jgi:hypothetical protein